MGRQIHASRGILSGANVERVIGLRRGSRGWPAELCWGQP